MITTNVLRRVFHISIGNASGTCFTVDVDRRQYLITAKHIAKDITDIGSVMLYHEEQWKHLEVTLVGHCDHEIDITVLTAKLQLSPMLNLPPTSDKLMYGQDVYFLGFPYGLKGEVGDINGDFPLPFVKKAIVSCMYKTDSDERIWFLDGHNNRGFSGGPVVFREPNKTELKIASVVAGYKYEAEPIYQGDRELPYTLKSNTGIIISYDIHHAIDVIEQNPIGYALN